ncbi:MAG: glycosyltransferase family 9 protein [Deltaproteobacteria bacterium]|nr:glycosyltransferase family 9 protein [Deltaproteobacteria bacterium]
MNILIIKLSAIGDVIHTLPSLAALRRLYPDAHITWVIEEAAADLIKDHPYLDRVVVSRRKSWIKELKRGRIAKPFGEIRSFIGEIKKIKYDLVIDFQGLFKSAVLVWLSSGKRKLGYASMQELSGLFLNDRIPEDMTKHAVDRYLDFPRYLGADIKEVEFLVPVQDDHKQRADKLLSANGISAHHAYVAVNPIALWETKLWGNEKFACLCDKLIEELGMTVVFTDSGPEEINKIQAMMRQPSVNLGGKTSLRDLACLYRGARFLITTDSGPMHLAAAVGTPVCAIFGPTDPARTGPFGKGHLVTRKDLPCMPCFRKSCRDMTCMKELRVEDVFGRIKGRFF